MVIEAFDFQSDGMSIAEERARQTTKNQEFREKMQTTYPYEVAVNYRSVPVGENMDLTPAIEVPLPSENLTVWMFQSPTPMVTFLERWFAQVKRLQGPGDAASLASITPEEMERRQTLGEIEAYGATSITGEIKRKEQNNGAVQVRDGNRD